MQCSYLVLWRVVELGIVALTVPVVQQVVVHQVPAPALVVRAEQRHVAVTLRHRLLRRDPDNRHGAERSLPDHLPRVPPAPEPDLAARTVRALRHGVPVQREAVRFDVDIVGAVPGVPRVVERA